MRDLDALATFVAVVNAGSFTGAAQALRIPRSTVSQRIARLEAALRTRLFERTTRVVRPTLAGQAYHQRCAQILLDIDEANAAVQELETEPRGLLRVATRHVLGQTFLAAFAAEFVDEHPAVEVELIVVDRAVNLVEEGFDVAVGIGGVDLDGGVIRRKLGVGERWCCATPAYLRRRPAPRTPDELAGHDCIPDGGGRKGVWRFEREGRAVSVAVHGRLGASSLLMAHRAALAGAGIASLPRVLCAADVHAGRLERVLSAWRVDPQDLLVLYPSNRYLSPRVRVFVESMLRRYRAAEATLDAPIARRAPRSERSSARGTRGSGAG